MNKLNTDFFTREALSVAPDLLYKILVRKTSSGKIYRLRITETEAYCGENDTACHARAGKTKRTSVMYNRGGYAYVYLCYGIHYLLNVVVNKENVPEAVLIRAGILEQDLKNYNGPAKLTKALEIDKRQNGVDFLDFDEMWIEDDGKTCGYTTSKRVGIGYATEPYKSIEWRFLAIQ